MQELLEKLLKSEEYSIVDNRKERINPTSEEIRFINSFVDEGDMLFCQLVYIESGKQQTILDMEEGAKSYSLLPFNLNSESKESDKKKKKRICKFYFISFSFQQSYCNIKVKSINRTRFRKSYILVTY